MRDQFYRAFEDVHRGSRELITERLRVYLEYIHPLLNVYPDAGQVLDLGCGRGEWLELLRNEGFEVKGVDLDGGMLQACEERQLPVEQAGALETLKQLEDDSLIVVSGFHLVEHVPFEYLLEMVTEAYRVLKPGGLVIFETPNAENLVVGTNNFYLDPTHKQPIPHQLMRFVTEYAGFHRNKVLRLQEPPELAESSECSLEQVLFGVSPDYAVVAQKPAELNVTEQFDGAFAVERGIGLAQLSRRYDKRWQESMEELKQQTMNNLEKVSQYAGSLEVRSAQLEILNQQYEKAITQSEQRISALSETNTSLTERVMTLKDELASVRELLAVSKAHEEHWVDEIEKLKSALGEANAKLNESFYKSLEWPERKKFESSDKHGSTVEPENTVRTMTPREQRIFAQLNRAIERRR